MRHYILTTALVSFVIALAGCSERERPKLTALFIHDVGYSEQDIRDLADAFHKENTKVDVLPFFTPYDSQYSKILTMAATRAQAYDVVVVDGIWTAEFAEGEFLVDATKHVQSRMGADCLPFAKEALTIEGKLQAMPWVTDCQFLYYNKRMLEAGGFRTPPRTWSEMEAQAKAIKAKGIVTYPIVAQWGHGDDVVCDFASMLFGRGGEFLSSLRRGDAAAPPPGQPAFADAAGVDSLGFMKRVVDEGLVNPASLEARSDDSRKILTEGQAAFNVNWMSAYDLANDPKQSSVVGEIGIALAPGEKDRKSVSVDRTFGLGVMASSRMQDMAWKFIDFLASKENLKKYCRGTLPVYRSLYDDPEFFGARPVQAPIAKEQYAYVRNRPSIFYYAKLSGAIQDAIEELMKGKKEPKAILDEAAARLKNAEKEKPIYKH